MMHAQTAQGGFPAKRDSQIDVPDADIEGLLERSDAEHIDWRRIFKDDSR